MCIISVAPLCTVLTHAGMVGPVCFAAAKREERTECAGKTDRIPFAVVVGSVCMALLSFVHAYIKGVIAPEIFAPIYYYCYYIPPSIFPFFVRLFRLPHQFPV